MDGITPPHLNKPQQNNSYSNSNSANLDQDDFFYVNEPSPIFWGRPNSAQQVAQQPGQDSADDYALNLEDQVINKQTSDDNFNDGFDAITGNFSAEQEVAPPKIISEVVVFNDIAPPQQEEFFQNQTEDFYSNESESEHQNLHNFNSNNNARGIASSETMATPNLTDEKVNYTDARIQEIEIAKISANPFQPRKIFNPEALQELASSIKEHGVVQPIVVTIAGEGFEIVVGERRFRASQLAGLTKIPAIVKKSLQDQTKLEVALIENIQRQELNAIEEAQAYERLARLFKMTQEQIAKKVGKSRPAVANTLRLLNLPAEIQRGVIEGKISEGHGRAILGLPDMDKQILLYKTILDQNLNVRQVESKVREITVRKRLDAIAPDPRLMAIETELRGKLNAQVKIQRQGRGGKIMIEFFSDEDLNDILEKIAQRENAPEGDNFFVV